MPPRIRFALGFSATVEQILELEAKGLKRAEIEPLVGIKKGQMSKSVRLYLTAHGRTPDSGHIEIRNRAAELVKMLDADEISLHNADEFLVEFIRNHLGNGKTTYRRALTTQSPDLQRSGYRRAIANLEGICYALDKMPEVIHSSISKAERAEFESRLAAVRRTIERRINIIRKDENAEADDQEG